MVKIERTPTPPASLATEKAKKSKKYNGDDVVEQLSKDFHDKCYLCEIDELQTVQVEHLVEHHGNLDLMFSWDNLFYSCGHCNNMKRRNIYASKILDCCKIDPETVLIHLFENGHVVVKPLDADCSDESVLLTAQLLTECFEYTNRKIREKQCKVRVDKLSETMTLLSKNLAMYKKNPKGRALNALRGMLSRIYKFAGFTRAYVRLHIDDYPELAPYVAV